MNSIALYADSMPATVLKGMKFAAPNSLQTITAYVEPSLAEANADGKLQFERQGYFVADQVNHKEPKMVFNKITGWKNTCNRS